QVRHASLDAGRRRKVGSPRPEGRGLRTYFLTVSEPLTGMPQTVPVYAIATVFDVLSIVAVLLLNENGQLTPPWPTRPPALHVMTLPVSVPLPEPFTLMLPAHVPANTTAALLVPVGVTVYVRLPQPVTGSVVAAVVDCHVPANAVIDAPVAGVVGEVGVV